MLGDLLRIAIVGLMIGLSYWLMVKPPERPHVPPSQAHACTQFPELSAERCQDLAEGRVWRGMTDNMGLMAWGVPDRVERTFGPWGVHERWMYEKPLLDRVSLDKSSESPSLVVATQAPRFLFFENGVLTHWQE